MYVFPCIFYGLQASSKDLSNNIISVLNCHSQAFKDIEAKQADIEKKLNSLQFNN